MTHQRCVLVTKTGLSFTSREEARRGSAVGEQGETEGLMRRLVEMGLRVVYLGKARGEVPGVEFVQPCTSHLTEDSDPREQENTLDSLAREVSEHEPLCAFNVCGPTATFSMIGNPKGSRVQAQGIHYTAPLLGVLHRLNLRRICVNNDPRTYPRDQEMSWGMPHCRPVALLDQCEDERVMTVGGIEYRRKSRYAACESWAWLPRDWSAPHEARIPCTIVAHAHIGDGCGQKRRDDAWWNVLGGRETWPDGLRVYGAGWEHYRDYDPEVMPGKVRPSEALELFGRARCTPCVAAAPGFYTGKPYVAMSMGCVPVLYGDGTDPYTWDPRGDLIGLGSAERVVRPGDLKRLAESFSDEEVWSSVRDEWAKELRPRWQVLDELVDDLLHERELGDRYGGYFRC